MRKTVFSLLNYIGCIGMALFVTFVIDGTIGMVLTYALIIALIVSLVMTLAVLRRVSVQSALSKSAVSKGDEIVCEIKLLNSMLIPTPLIEVEIESSAHFSHEGDNVFQGSVTGKGVNTLGFSLKAIHSGKAHVRIKSLMLTDYLGIFSFRLNAQSTDLEVAIYPDIPDISVQTNLLKTSSLFTNNDDDEEESSDSSSVPTGLAGYDHREYVPGDPLKRINWKLSSKRDILMVRLDEMIKGSGRTFLFDCPVSQENEAILTVRDNVIEGALALLVSMVSDGRDATFFYHKQGIWMSIEIHTLQDVYRLQEEFSDYEPTPAFESVPTKLTQLSKAPICFTAATVDTYASAEQIVSQYPDTMIVASYCSSLPVITSNQWIITDIFELNKV